MSVRLQGRVQHRGAHASLGVELQCTGQRRAPRVQPLWRALRLRRSPLGAARDPSRRWPLRGAVRDAGGPPGDRRSLWLHPLVQPREPLLAVPLHPRSAVRHPRHSAARGLGAEGCRRLSAPSPRLQDDPHCHRSGDLAAAARGIGDRWAEEGAQRQVLGSAIPGVGFECRESVAAGGPGEGCVGAGAHRCPMCT